MCLQRAPSQRRAYIDLMGVDSRGDIHVIETKIDTDSMLAIQGLDYWAWATEHSDDLAALLRSRGHTVGDEPTIRLDYVIGTKADDDAVDLRDLAHQLGALDGAISWRVGQVQGWRSPRRTVPTDHAPASPRFALVYISICSRTTVESAPFRTRPSCLMPKQRSPQRRAHLPAACHFQ
jgi:hypothetical protein